jgi:Protein kinase domain
MDLHSGNEKVRDPAQEVRDTPGGDSPRARETPHTGQVPGSPEEASAPSSVSISPHEPSTTPESPSEEPARSAALVTFGKYEVLQELASGGMGVVYKVRDTALGRIVALKRIRSGVLAEAAEVQRFQREARAMAQLDHPHIVRIYEVGESDGHQFFTMAFAPKGSLVRQLVQGRIRSTERSLVTRRNSAPPHLSRARVRCAPRGGRSGRARAGFRKPPCACS